MIVRKTDKTAIIIGGGSGIGKSCAFKLKENGYNIGVFSPNNALDVAKELEGVGYRGSAFSSADLEKFIEKVNQRFGSIQVVINSTGHAAKGDLFGLSEENWHHGLDLFLLNILKVAKLVISQMVEQKEGVFVNISSFTVRRPSEDYIISSLLRPGLTNLAKIFSKEYGKYGIRMNNIQPGYVNNFPIQEKEIIQIPLGRSANIEEISDVVAFLASEKASYITGQEILVDGGFCISN